MLLERQVERQEVLVRGMGISLASQPYFSAYAHARAKVGGGREEKIRLGTPARFSWLQLKILS